MSYPDYRHLVFRCASKGTCSGEKSEEHIKATLLNAQRIKKTEEYFHLRPELLKAIKIIKEPFNWFLLCETWCNDDAHCAPLIARIADLSPNIHFYLLLRDENPLLMDQFLTRGKRAIPKFICQHRKSKSICGMWGPRPTRINDLANEFQLLNRDSSKDEFNKQLQLWYGRDKGNSLQEDFISILEKCSHNIPVDLNT